MSTVSKPDFQTVRHNIEKALSLLYRDDLFLITNCSEERAITHKLAEYIQLLFPEWHVDCEYNRLAEDAKDINGQRTSYPDIIVHRRNTHDNLLVIEAKSIHSRNHSDIKDKQKIAAYINDARYGYYYGLWICFYDDLTQTQLDWFENHNGVCSEMLI